jgi:hypothetical protein
MIKKIAIAANSLGILCCLGMFYVYSHILLLFFHILFRADAGSVAIIGGDPNSSAFLYFWPFFFTIICTIVFLMNLFVVTRKAKR